jgi:hypothetical protein
MHATPVALELSPTSSELPRWVAGAEQLIGRLSPLEIAVVRRA